MASLRSSYFRHRFREPALPTAAHDSAVQFTLLVASGMIGDQRLDHSGEPRRRWTRLRLTTWPWVASHADPPRAVIRPCQVLPIDQRHDRAVFLADLGRPAVDRSAGDRQQSALSRYRQRWSRALDQTAPFRSAHLPSFRDKKSFSTFSLPICRYRTSTCAALAVSSAAAPPPSKTLVAPSKQLLLPGVDLVRVNPVRARQ